MCICHIFRFGPLSRLWCMRFEANNSYFKRLGQTIGNFKNIAKTLATRHQRLSCYHLSCNEDDIYGDLTTIGKSKKEAEKISRTHIP